MSLAVRCLQHFDPMVRTRGQHYFNDGQVVLRDSPRNEFHAVVRGAAEYRVYLDWGSSREQLAVCCTCPYYADKGFCKHIWAAILAADAKSVGPKGRRPIDLLAMDPEDYDLSDDESWLDEDLEDDESDAGNNRAPPRRTGKSATKSRPKRDRSPPVPKWQQQLAWAGSAEADDVPPPVLTADSWRTREVWYVLDALSDQNVSEPVLLLYQREVRANGKLGKLKQFSVRPYDIDRLVAGADAEILKLLLGYQSVDDDYIGHGYSPRVTEVALPKGAQQFLLPKMAATGRLARIEPQEAMQQGPETVRPLSWDEGPPWRFRLDIARDDQRQQWVLSGQLHREGGECVPLTTALTIFKQGIVVFADRIALMETAGVARMIEALQKTPRVEVPYKDRWDLLRRLWQLPAAPDMNLPEELRAEEVQLRPQGRLTVDKPERYDPYRLPGRVDFLYGDKVVSAQERRAESSTTNASGSFCATASGSASWPPRWQRGTFGPRTAGRPIVTTSGSAAPTPPRRWRRSSTRAGSSRPKATTSAAPARSR